MTSSTVAGSRSSDSGGIFTDGAVLAVNLMGDGLRDALDPRAAKRV